MKWRGIVIKASGDGGPASRASDAKDRQLGQLRSSWPTASDFEPGAASLLDFEHEELLEFLATDLSTIQADPAFRERLRLELWWMILSGIEPGSFTPGN